ncbi:MAG TPA: hypothetical protein VFP42_10495 [Acidimicrobiia bacterium]|nr:hypothetical protein [Acidimicrobiia bacterium]
MSEVVGLFPSQHQAQDAVDRLTDLGYDAGTVGYVDRHRDQGGEIVTDPDHFDDDHDMEHHEVAEEAGKGAAGGAIGGAAVGAGAALLASAGLVLIPGVGPFLAAGTIAGVLGSTAVGAAGGAVLGGATGAIFGAVEEHEHADHDTSRHYRERVSEGDAMVSVDADSMETAKVADVMRQAGATDVNVYGDEGWVAVD